VYCLVGEPYFPFTIKTPRTDPASRSRDGRSARLLRLVPERFLQLKRRRINPGEKTENPAQ
jgi:hypothetical protein